ncbi:MAG: acetyl-CoA carboxylase, biotin carboxyl carrier protein [Herpetosiphonaceae bacterium]|nr:MAG: acetyl-CoA carboxylase, biotin carboxyl carrier protein [Herpetosiphonaceae bacterium]
MHEQAHDGPAFLTHEIRELLQLICQTDITELQIERGGAKIHIKRGMNVTQASLAAAAATPAAQPALSGAAAAVAHVSPETPTQAGGYTITAPMVGTFYRAPSPKDPSYVNEGDEIYPGDVIGIVEAMKMMNEIESEIHGRVISILVQNGQPVEYGQPLMVIQPLG